jgi:hypothetical protein
MGTNVGFVPALSMYIYIRCADWHLGLWGIGVGAAISLFMSDVPVFKQDVLLKIPFVRFQAPFFLSGVSV